MLEVAIQKKLGSFALDVAFSAGNEVLSLLGGSGCGKSMTLRCIAGIVTPDAGRIVVDGTVFFDSEQKINLSPRARQVGLLFQNYALFPSMTVMDNILCGLREKLPKAEKRQRAAALIQKFRLEGLEQRLPGQLSGGQQQRTALARMLIGAPRILMLDEPFSALDSHLRWAVEQETMAVVESFPGTTLLVSHSRDEVYRISQKIAVMDAGKINTLADRQALFQDPGTYTAALLSGCKNLADADVSGGRAHVSAWGITLNAPLREADCIGIRSHDLTSAAAPGENTFPYQVVRTIEDPFNFVLMIRVAPGAEPLRWEMPKADYDALPEHGYVRFPKEKLLLLRK